MRDHGGICTQMKKIRGSSEEGGGGEKSLLIIDVTCQHYRKDSTIVRNTNAAEAVIMPQWAKIPVKNSN